MINHLRHTSTFAVALMLAACAATTADVHPKTGTPVAAQNPACLTQTGSRITGDEGHCSAFGHSYSNTDIERTGATSADDALRLLDPSITTHH
jgi:hypothetical protein